MLLVLAGRRKLLGNFNEVGREAAEVAMAFISINASAIRSWLTGEAPTDAPLQNRAADVCVEMGRLDLAKQGSSAAACQVMQPPVTLCVCAVCRWKRLPWVVWCGCSAPRLCS